MKRLTYFFVGLMTLLMAVSCQNTKKNNTAEANGMTSDTTSVTDTTVYGKVVDGGMSVFQMVTDEGDTVEYVLENELGEPVEVKGGYNIGDRLAVTAYKFNGENIVRQAINLLSLQGHWTSIDRNFTIEEGGIVSSEVQTEKNPWTSWKILNGQLVLNRQAFDVDLLSADSLALEDSTGIYVYKRQN